MGIERDRLVEIDYKIDAIDIKQYEINEYRADLVAERAGIIAVLAAKESK